VCDSHLAGDGPPIVLLAGEPGIGKSRLLAEATRQAISRGWPVVEDGCQRRGSQETFAPLVGALGSFLLWGAGAGRRRGRCCASVCGECLYRAEATDSPKNIVKARRLRAEVFIARGEYSRARAELEGALEVERVAGQLTDVRPRETFVSSSRIQHIRQLAGDASAGNKS
jgi:hypothetical protein